MALKTFKLAGYLLALTASIGAQTFAEACPSCGRYFRMYARTFTVRPGDGWSIAMFWGIMLAWIIPTLLCIALIVVLFILGAIGAASLTQPRTTPTTTTSRP